jgi:hypothetical protein
VKKFLNQVESVKEKKMPIKKKSTKVKMTNVSLKILESKELNRLLERVESLRSDIHLFLLGIGPVFHGDDRDPFDDSQRNPEFLNWISAHKTFFKVGGFVIAATFKKIKNHLEEELKNRTEEEKKLNDDELTTLSREIGELQEQLDEKMERLKKFQKGKKK